MLIGSEAETEGAGGLDLPMEIISCHLFPRRKNWYEPPSRSNSTPPPPPGWNCLDTRTHVWQEFYFLHIAGLAIILSTDSW